MAGRVHGCNRERLGTAVAAVHCAIGLRPCRWMERAEPCERGSPTPGQTTSDRQRRYARQRPSQSFLLTATFLYGGRDRETTDSIAALLGTADSFCLLYW